MTGQHWDGSIVVGATTYPCILDDGHEGACEYHQALRDRLAREVSGDSRGELERLLTRPVSGQGKDTP